MLQLTAALMGKVIVGRLILIRAPTDRRIKARGVWGSPPRGEVWRGDPQKAREMQRFWQGSCGKLHCLQSDGRLPGFPAIHDRRKVPEPGRSPNNITR